MSLTLAVDIDVTGSLLPTLPNDLANATHTTFAYAAIRARGMPGNDTAPFSFRFDVLGSLCAAQHTVPSSYPPFKGTPLTKKGTVHVAVLSCFERAVLAHRSAR